jgi:ADP-heptose:LPS heptosyltransferase
MGALGDVILTTPIVRKLFQDRDGFCAITVRTHHPEVFRGNPYVAAVMSGSDEYHIADFDIVLNLDLVYERNPACHILEAYGFHVFGNASFPRQCELFVEADDSWHATQLQQQWASNYIVVHMRRTVQRSRNLPEEFWRDLIVGLLATSTHAIVQIGMPSELAFGGDSRLIDLRGKLSIHALRQVIAGSCFYLGVDSAPFHVATTTDVDMAIFFTTAKAEYRKPYRAQGKFQALTPNIECYGCQEKMPLGSTLVVCARGDEDCVNRFDARKVLDIIHAQVSTISNPSGATS